jgi:kinesin family protein 4/21/27
LAYGQTGSGKTYSMGTANREDSTPDHQEGVIPRAVREIFYRIEGLKTDYDFNVRVAFVELYKERLYDLLSTKSKMKDDCIVDLREDPVRGVIITNLTEVVVDNLYKTMQQLEHGSVKRVTAATAMNNTSSRSHAIFTVYIEGTRKSDSLEEDDDENGRPSNIVAKFHLVDLAGSERAKKTKTTGLRYKEGVSINLGLLALGNVISALGDDSGPKTHIPYRDSKLTRLLQDSLGGNSHTLMIACVGPADTNLEETISTLRYADRARKIKNKPVVNHDGKDAENSKLRREIAELKIQLLNSGGGGGGGGGGTLVDSKELKDCKSRTSQLTAENRDLTSALMSCQEELGHMNEKLLLTESTDEKMKTKMCELAAEAESLLKRTPLKEDVENILRKIRDVINVQTDSEKSMAEHELSRFDSSNTALANSMNEDDDFGAAARALQQNALATQLATLNKQLAQKEQYANVLNVNEDKLREVRDKYEDQLHQLESQMRNLEKEKDQLNQQNRAEPTSKISEARRKRIQDLEAALSDLKKKVIEQQRMIKMNEKNAAKVKQLAEEIRSMKQAKVRLIRQMKEDAEKMRTFKAQKEKEVIQLKQTERKQQAQMVKMETLHSKQQNVMKRKMEEACAANKRLKDVIDKQKASRKTGTKQTGLAGAAERMRNLVSQELEVVVSVKEAKQSREQLVTDRGMLTKQLADIKNQTRMTMTNSEREELHQRKEELEELLSLRKVQISELQKQIMDADASNNDEESGGHASNTISTKWWDTLQTMTEAKIALQYLFEKAAEHMANHSASENTIKEIKHLYEEAVKNTEVLEEEISNLKDEHYDKLHQVGRENAEYMALLLKPLTSSTNSGLKDSELQKLTKLQEELMKLSQDVDANKRRNEAAKKAKKSAVRYTVEELLHDDSADIVTDQEDDEEMFDDDPDWYQTPLIRRIKKIRETALHQSNAPKRKLGETFEANSFGVDLPKAKRSNSSSGLGGCACKTGCRTKRCQCVKADKACSDLCKCPLSQCANRQDRHHDHGQNSSSEADVLADTTNQSNNSTSCTMSLLSDTYQVPDEQDVPKRKITVENAQNRENILPSAPRKTDEHRASMFKSPRVGYHSSTESLLNSSTPPPPTPLERKSLFKSPL